MFRNNRPIRSLCRAVLDLTVAWWRIDRVRVSPHEGELLRLPAASLVMISGRPVEVLRRQEGPAGGIRGVAYECRTEAGPACLDVRLHENSGQLEIRWTESGRTATLWEHQIEVFG